MKPEPFRIAVAEAVLEDLRRRLRRTRWASGPRDASWDFGTSPAYLKELVAYWLNGFDWRRQEAALNRFSHFKAEVGGGRIHFIHEGATRTKGEESPTRVPLLLLHGWPDSFYRYYKVIPRLAAEGFEVIVPSLPEFGFTGPVPRASPEQPTRQSAQLLWRLMTDVLGHRRFAVVGGDGGSVLAQILAIDHPDSVEGIHLTDLGWQTGNVDPATVSKPEQKYLAAGKKGFLTDGAYAMVQSTRPQSLAPALTDSPTGLLAWILDRFYNWGDCGGDIEKSFSKDELLTNIMIYWVTQTIGPSMASYRADVVSPSLSAADHVDVPVGLALFPKDGGGIPPRAFAERTLNVQSWTEMPHGGHLGALEEPETYARDIVTFFRGLEAAHLRPSAPEKESGHVGSAV